MDRELGFGPMSANCTDALLSYSKDQSFPLMIISSRNQIDHDRGYVMTTEELSKKARNSDLIKLCRDHCGPFFNDDEKNLSIDKAIDNTKKTIEEDISQGFRLIHIDTSRCEEPYKTAEELIKFTLDLNPDCELEFGTEENIGKDTTVEKYREFVDFSKNFPAIKYVVAQTGSLVMEDRQVGSTSIEVLTRLVDVAKENHVKLKEHNADYLDQEQLLMRKNSGVHALNIAPQLGVTETQVVLEMSQRFGINTGDFRNRVLESQKWKKWHIDCDDDKKVIIAGHYLFKDPSYKIIIDSLNLHIDINSLIQQKIHKIIDHYRQFYVQENNSK